MTDDFQVNDDQGNNSQGSPSIDIDNSGNFIICWSDSRNASLDIYGQQFYWNGQPIGQNFLVYNDGGISDQHNPAVAMDGEGNFVVIWNDFQGNKNHTYARLFNKNRDPISSVFRVDDNGRPDNNIKSHALGRDKVSGNFLIAWCEETPNYFDYIYIQRYFNDGTPNGAYFLTSGISTITKDISIASDNNGNFYIAYLWIDNTQLAIKAAKYNFNSTNSQFNINVRDLSTYLDCPSIAAKSIGDFVVTWEQHNSSQYGKWDIYAQRFNGNGSGIGSYFQVSEDLSDDQQGPDVSIDNTGNFVITREDKRNGNWDIYAQQYESNGQTIGNNYRVNSDIGDSTQVNCAVSLKTEMFTQPGLMIENWNPILTFSLI